MLLLDTHVLLWSLTEDPSLGRRCRTLVRGALARQELAVSTVSFWEVAMLADKGRITLSLSPGDFRQVVLDQGIRELALGGDSAVQAAGIGLHGDPADRFIAATALTHGAALVTADVRLLDWKHPLKRINARR